MLNTELHWVQLCIWYIRLVMTPKLDKLQHAIEYCHTVRCVLRIVEWCLEVFDYIVRILSITAVLGSHKFTLCIWLGAQGGGQIRTRREDFRSGRAVLPALSEGLEFDLSDIEAENATLKADHLQQVVEIVIGGVPNVFEVHFMCLFMSLGRIMLPGSRLKYHFDSIRHHMDPQRVELGISLLVIIYPVADIIPPGIHFVPLLGRHPCYCFWFLVCIARLHEFHPQRICCGLRLVAPSRE